MRILIQAGHKGRTTGATGAPGEQKWTSEIVPKISSILISNGIEVREVGADPTNAELAGDWDLFLAVHYDADVYNDRGGFIDYQDPKDDGATEESQRIANIMRSVYFPATGIPEHNERSNRNTREYYMWSRISSKTPCVLIEAGVGWRTPEDHRTLHFEQDKVAKAIADGIIKALKGGVPTTNPLEECLKQHVALVNEAVEREKQIKELTDTNKILADKLEECESAPISTKIEPSIEIAGSKWQLNGIQVTPQGIVGNYKKV